MTAGGGRSLIWAGRIAAAAIISLAFVGTADAAAKKAKHAAAKSASKSAAAKKAPVRKAVRIPNAQLEPINWSQVEGWRDDDHIAAFAAFSTSCKAVLRSTPATRKAKPVYGALYQACVRSAAVKPRNADEAREYFEQSFRPVRISPLGTPDGFITGYYEPVVEGSRHRSQEYSVPLYRTPPGLQKGGRMAIKTTVTDKKGKKRTVRKLVPFHERAAIDDGALEGRKLEIVYLKDPIDSFFAQIQGSVRVKLDDGKMLRLNYDSQNGHPYTAVGKFLIERGHVSKDEMSMDRIRQWMTANPKEGNEIRRLNKSYVFFRETKLAETEEPKGAQGVSLTPGRSIAVDRNLHVYGTPFFISADLPLESEQPTTKFRRLMVAQDTGGAIIGPARADLYFGAGDEAGSVSGRLRHSGKFVMLFPHEIDPARSNERIPLPKPRPAIVEAENKTEPSAVAAADEPVDDKPKAKAAKRKQ
jgi:membrane-bound lytic murein transglycosylase A